MFPQVPGTFVADAHRYHVFAPLLHGVGQTDRAGVIGQDEIDRLLLAFCHRIEAVWMYRFKGRNPTGLLGKAGAVVGVAGDGIKRKIINATNTEVVIQYRGIRITYT